MSRGRILVGLLASSSLFSLACGGPDRADTLSASPEDRRIAVGLRLLEAPSAGSVPQTRVVLVVVDPSIGRTTAPVGTFAGPCVYDAPLPDSVVTVRCWWAEDETTISVVKRGGEAVADVRQTRTTGVQPDAPSLPISAGAPVVSIGAAWPE